MQLTWRARIGIGLTAVLVMLATVCIYSLLSIRAMVVTDIGITHAQVAHAGTAGILVVAGTLLAMIVASIAAILLRSHLERRLRSEALYGSLVHALVEGVFVRDSKGRIVECNESATRILGISREELLRSGPGELICFREDGTPMPLAERPGTTAAEDGDTKSQILGIRRPDGEMRWLLASASPMFVEGSKELAGTTTSFSDITLRIEAEAEVREQREQMQDFLENAGDLILITNADGRLLYTNHAFRTALGVQDGTELKGRSLAELLDAPSREDHRQRIPRLLAGETLSDVQTTFVRSDGLPVVVSGNISCRMEGGFPVAFRAIMRDMTEINTTQEQLLLALEQASAANRAKSEFLANMSHELRTPLNSVIGFASVLLRNKQGRFESQDLQYLSRIHDNGRHLLGLINSVLDLSKVEAGQMDVELGEIDLGALVRETLEQMESHVHGRPVALRAVVPENLARFRADKGKLKQVLINLTANALKFTAEGTVTVRVTADAAGVPRAIDVIDTGIGIPLERQAAVFEAFQQADNSTARKYGGSGLGLTITRSLCQLMGYDISLASEPGRGSTLTVSLGGAPAMPVEPEPELLEADRPRVLIIDDDPDARLLLAQYVRDAGCRAILVASGADGLESARRDPPSLILLDLMMPVMNGFEVLQQARLDPLLTDIPVVIVSIVATEHSRRSVGAAALINKPVAREEIEAVLRRFVAEEPKDKHDQLDELIRRALAVHA